MFKVMQVLLVSKFGIILIMNYSLNILNMQSVSSLLWRRGVAVIITVPLHSTKTQLRLGAGSNTACDVSEIGEGEDL